MVNSAFITSINPAALALFIGIIIVLAIWSAIWKALALWKSARKGSLVWFIIFLVVNTLGILEILYLYVFSEKTRVEKRKR